MNIKLHNIGSYMFKNYLLETPLGWIVIDTGYASAEKKFLERLSSLCKLEELAYIFLTHAHDDHAGFLASLLEKTPARLVMHRKGLASLAAGKPLDPPGAGFSNRLARLFGLVHNDFSYPKVFPDDKTLYIDSDADQVFKALGLPLRIVCLPGHSNDSIGLYIETTGELLCGDAAMNAIGSFNRYTIWIDDLAEYGRSWDKIIALNPSKILPSHGGAFDVADLVRFRHKMDGKKLYK